MQGPPPQTPSPGAEVPAPSTVGPFFLLQLGEKEEELRRDAAGKVDAT
jgi:hypothetical protein